MKESIVNKYKPYRPVSLPDRTWPDRFIEKAPRWCSVDLRDGNQALIIPMNLDEKIRLFRTLVSIGFKEIEVGFPSASEVEYEFLRNLIEKDLIPDDVTVQVLTQAREHLISKTFDALKGARQAVLHLYNSTSELQRRVVFRKDQESIKELAIEGTRLVKAMTAMTDTKITLEYSPESFTGTETDYAVAVCESVMDIWQPTVENPVILNLPATVEMSTPNLYADQIEYFIRKLNGRDRAVISLHAHNDRGTAVAATELALQAGADRVEGTLFGNGERTGNVDLVTLSLNMMTQGVNPNLDFSDINKVIEVSESVTRIPVHLRHPYAGELVYTAFSGSHQDAINKGMDYRNEMNTDQWEVPYLPIDPTDVGRSYESIIRINSQSGKGGVAYIMEKEYGYQIPKTMHMELGSMVQSMADRTGKEIQPGEIVEQFKKIYLDTRTPFEYISFYSQPESRESEEVTCQVEFKYNGELMALEGRGNGPIDACKHALHESSLFTFTVESYHEHSLDHGSSSRAICYIQLKSEDGRLVFGVGIDPNITRASIRALFSALNRMHEK